MGKKEKLRNEPIHAGRILLIALGLILFSIVFLISQRMVSDIFYPAPNRRPVSLVCEFVDLEFSKESVISNITGEDFTRLTIEMKNGEIEEYAIPSSEILKIEEVGLLSWKNGEILGILPTITTIGTYTIEYGYITYFGEFGSKHHIMFLVVEKFHPPTLIEQAIIHFSDALWVIFLVLLSTSFTLILVPLFGTGRFVVV